MTNTWRPLAVTLAIQALVAMALITVPVIAPVLAQDLGISSTYVGIYVGVVYAAAMLASLSAGAAVARFGAIRVSQVALLLCAAGLALSTLGSVTVEEQLMGFPLKLQIARDFIAPRLALVGDAAHVVHPIAGQGLNLGLKDVAALAEVVIGAVRLGLDHGGDDVLGRYQAWRRLDTASMAAMTDGLNRLFSNDVAPVRALRDFGLGLVDRAGPIKSALIRTASGVSASGPRLLSGLPI